MEERRRITTLKQLELLTDFLVQHKDVALGRVRDKEARARCDNTWRECAAILNSEGPARTPKEWAKVWSELKSKVRIKIMNNRNSATATGGGPSNIKNLSPVEETVAQILGHDVGPLEGVRQNQFQMQEPEQNDLENVLQEEGRQLEVEHMEAGTVPMSVPNPSGHTTAHHTPTNSSRGGQQRRRIRAQRRPTVEHPEASINRLDDARNLVVRIEEMRARAALTNAESFNLLARSIERFSEWFTQRHN